MYHVSDSHSTFHFTQDLKDGVMTEVNRTLLQMKQQQQASQHQQMTANNNFGRRSSRLPPVYSRQMRDIIELLQPEPLIQDLKSSDDKSDDSSGESNENDVGTGDGSLDKGSSPSESDDDKNLYPQEVNDGIPSQGLQSSVPSTSSTFTTTSNTNNNGSDRNDLLSMRGMSEKLRLMESYYASLSKRTVYLAAGLGILLVLMLISSALLYRRTSGSSSSSSVHMNHTVP